jgi:toxin ParE1/3/4
VIVHLSAESTQDFRDIWEYVAEDSPRAADRLLDRLNTAVRRLGAFPLMGVARDDLAPGLRAMRVDNFVVFYRLRNDDLVVERILHARLDATGVNF